MNACTVPSAKPMPSAHKVCPADSKTVVKKATASTQRNALGEKNTLNRHNQSCDYTQGKEGSKEQGVILRWADCGTTKGQVEGIEGIILIGGRVGGLSCPVLSYPVLSCSPLSRVFCFLLHTKNFGKTNDCNESVYSLCFASLSFHPFFAFRRHLKLTFYPRS